MSHEPNVTRVSAHGGSCNQTAIKSYSTPKTASEKCTFGYIVVGKPPSCKRQSPPASSHRFCSHLIRVLLALDPSSPPFVIRLTVSAAPPLSLPMTNRQQDAESIGASSLQDVSESSSMIAAEEPSWPRSWRAYACWLGCFFLMFNSWGLVNAYGTFSSYYVGHSLRFADQLELNLIGSTQSALVLLFSAPVGRLLDAGHFRAVISTGSLLVPFGMFMLSIAHPRGVDDTASFGAIWATQGFVVGLGMACFFVSSSQGPLFSLTSRTLSLTYAVAATWFPNRKALAVGVVACGASVAGVVYPAMLRFLIDELGFNNAVRCVAGLAGVTSLYTAIFATPNPDHVHPRPQSYRALKTWIDPEAFGNKAFCWFTAAVAFMFFGFYPVFFNLEEVREWIPLVVEHC